MTTGHLNAGYEEIVSQNKLALNNPSGARTAFQRSSDELKDIRDAAKAVWAGKDNYETTYGRYHKFINIILLRLIAIMAKSLLEFLTHYSVISFSG